MPYLVGNHEEGFYRDTAVMAAHLHKRILVGSETVWDSCDSEIDPTSSIFFREGNISTVIPPLRAVNDWPR